MTESIFADMAKAWDGTCGGGIWWSKERKYKNAIANELFLSVAAHLANRTTGRARRDYLSWGNREWSWFQATGMINPGNLINDGLGKGPGGTTGTDCVNNHGTIWSYNQGVVLGGLAELSVANHNPSLPLAAQKFAMATVTQLVDSKGVLHDPCEPKCGADGEQFKGIFVRNLVLLNQRYPQGAYENFVTTNADAIWNQAQGPDYQLGQAWSGPFVKANAATQSSALDALVGTLFLNSGSSRKRSVSKTHS
jgi:predicted alpha-1,6-mannanase (GH76 family)